MSKKAEYDDEDIEIGIEDDDDDDEEEDVMYEYDEGQEHSSFLTPFL